MPQNEVWGNIRSLDSWGEGRKKCVGRFKMPYLPISYIAWSILFLGKDKKACLPFCLSVLFTLLEIPDHR